jgi:hypothetical protein
MLPPARLVIVNRRVVNSALALVFVGSYSTAKAQAGDVTEAATTEIAVAFLDLVDAGKGEEAIARYASTSAANVQRLRAYLIARQGVGSLSNRRVVEAKRTELGIKLMIRYSAPESPRQGTNNRKLARHNEYLDLSKQKDGSLQVSDFGFAD